MAIFNSNAPFELECKGTLPELRIAYTTYGMLNKERSNVVWVCHALTANSQVADWWPNTVVGGGLLDPKKWFVVCANKLGSPYGSSCPVDGGWDDIVVTFRDVARAHQMLARHLGIGRIARLIGGSTGGMQAMEWAYLEPDRFDLMALIFTLPQSTPWIVASSEAQRMAIQAGGYSKEGVAAARAIAMLQYRGERAYNLTQWDDDDKLKGYKTSSYQRYQGKKLSDRFDARCYMTLLDMLDSHNIGRGRGGVKAALSRITTPTIVIGGSSDIMFPSYAVSDMAACLPQAEYHCIESDFGHDGFLIETPTITRILTR